MQRLIELFRNESEIEALRERLRANDTQGNENHESAHAGLRN